MTIWNDIPGYETRYQASTMGEIRSLDWEMGNRWNGTTPRRGRVLKPETTNRGYLRVVLCDLNGAKKWSVHKLITLTFIGPPPLDSVVNHIDGNKLNNKPENLEYVTHKQNVSHSVHELSHSRQGKFNNAAKLNENQVVEIRSLFDTGRYTKRELGKTFGVSEVLVGKVIRREIWRHVA